MNKQGVVLVVLSLVVVITLVAAVIHEKSLKESPSKVPAAVEQSKHEGEYKTTVKTPDFEKMEKTGVYDPNDPRLTPPPVVSNQEKQQNALDAMAPGYKKANERLEHAKEARKKALDSHQEDMNRLRLNN